MHLGEDTHCRDGTVLLGIPPKDVAVKYVFFHQSYVDMT